MLISYSLFPPTLINWTYTVRKSCTFLVQLYLCLLAKTQRYLILWAILCNNRFVAQFVPVWWLRASNWLLYPFIKPTLFFEHFLFLQHKNVPGEACTFLALTTLSSTISSRSPDAFIFREYLETDLVPGVFIVPGVLLLLNSCQLTKWGNYM